MGVDYTGHYGIGFKIKRPSDEVLGEMDLDIDSYLSEVIPSNCSYFEVGSGAYSGEDNDYYVIIDAGLDEGWDVAKEQCDILYTTLLNEGLIYKEDKVDVVGGLQVW